MARRILNKACNDLVGGAGTEVSATLGCEIPRKPSRLKLASRDPNYGNRQAVEVKPTSARQVPRSPQRVLQVVHPSRRDNVKVEENRGKPRFVNIDGDGSVKQVDVPSVQQPKAGPQTAYKARSFMSSVDLGPRGHPRLPTQAKQNPEKPSNPPPRREPNVPNVSHQPGDGKMFLPKGIHHTDQPYVVPKFMPSYREMMVPKLRPDPLVSIVENTPPSLQKWAVEWNAEPKKTISIDELKEDLVREAAEKSHKPPGKSQQVSSIRKPNPDEMYEDRKSDDPNNTPKNHSSYVEPVGKPPPNASERINKQPWNDLHFPASYETRMENQGLRNLEPEQQKIGRPLVDWVPPKYSSSTRFPSSHRDTKYSFQEAINNGTPKKTSLPEPAEPKPFFPNPAENAVYYETEEQRFHNWFKEKMSAAAQSAVNRPKVMPKNNHARFQAPHSNNKFSAVKDPSKPGNMTSANPIGQNKLVQAERDPINNFNQSNKLMDLDGVIPPEVRAHPEHTNNAPVASYEPERNSSFYHWLKLRGHHTAKNEPNPPESKKELERTNQHPLDAPLFPWSSSYTLRRRVSTPVLIPKRVATPTAVPQRPSTAKNFKKSQKPVSKGDTTLKLVKNSISKSANSIDHKRIKSASKKSHKTIGERPVKSARKKSMKSNSKVYIKNSNKKMPKVEPPSRVPASPEHPWLNDIWNVDSEIDHVNNLRKMEIFGNSPKATNMKKLFPSMGGQHMKYWETKYIKKPGELTQKVPQGVDNEGKPNSYNWYTPKKATNGIKNVQKDATVKNADNRTDRGDESSNLSATDEYSIFPTNLSQNAKDEVMDFSEDFDVDRCLNKEEAVEKELMNSTHGQEKVEGDGKPENDQNAKVKGKEHIKFPRKIKVEANDVDLKKRVQQKLDEDEFVLAFGEDPGLEDLEWSEFIGPKNSLDHDSDLTRLLGAQARQLGAVQHSCL